MEKIIRLYPAYDKRHSDPNKNYGIHGVDLKFVLMGESGAVQFNLFTNWQLPHVTKEHLTKATNSERDIELFFMPMPADLGYHSKVPHYSSQLTMSENCEFTGGVCYYDGSTLNAERVYDILLEEGSDGVWKELEEYYNSVFGEYKNE